MHADFKIRAKKEVPTAKDMQKETRSVGHPSGSPGNQLCGAEN
jgi:hypothetical protein